MFGRINDCTEKLVISKFGVQKWHEIKEKAGCLVVDNGFVRHEYYSDESTIELVAAASEVLGITIDQVLEAFGQLFMEFTRAEGFENLLQCQGNTLRSWMSNMNALHDHLESSLPRGMVKPVFWCEDDEDSAEGAMILHYHSKRGNLLVPIVVGVVKEVARYHFDVEVEMTMLQKQAVDGATHTSWTVKATDPSESWKITVRESNPVPEGASHQHPAGKCPITGMTFSTSASPSAKKLLKAQDDAVDLSSAPLVYRSSNSSHNPEHDGCGSLPQSACQCTAETMSRPPKKEPSISGRQMKKLFPYHLVVDEVFDILQVGSSLPRILERDEQDLVGRHIVDVLSITKPVLGSWDWKSLRKLEDQTFFLDPVVTSSGNCTHVHFKATIVRISDPGEADQIMLVLSPDVRNVKELRSMKLTMSDLPLHSFQRDAVFLGEHILSEVQSSHKLDRLSKKLQNEKELSNALLNTLLPPHIATELRAGNAIDPELHEEVTLFFSDIVGFTTICDQIFPWDCIKLLNRLYCVMDYLAEHFELYKIETIGDSYLCASGLPYNDADHARKVANFAIAVLHCCRLVENPTNGEPIQMRIGIHSGPCMTGVVGMKTPHYCVFGDTVNTASRHESSGVAGKTQCSFVTYNKLAHSSESSKKFKFNPRGMVDMKGKGPMATYFLEGATLENEDANERALDILYAKVEEMLSKKKFSNKRYFKRYRRRQSETCFGSA